jgi:hypothetical protein
MLTCDSREMRYAALPHSRLAITSRFRTYLKKDSRRVVEGSLSCTSGMAGRAESSARALTVVILSCASADPPRGREYKGLDFCIRNTRNHRHRQAIRRILPFLGAGKHG